MNRISYVASALRSSFWFLPALIVATSLLLAIGLIEVDLRQAANWLPRWPVIFGASPESSRGMLSTIAGSMMTVVLVTFSMTLVTLALASSQYTSRILRVFTSDRFTQVVLGLFTGSFSAVGLTVMDLRLDWHPG